MNTVLAAACVVGNGWTVIRLRICLTWLLSPSERSYMLSVSSKLVVLLLSVGGALAAAKPNAKVFATALRRWETSTPRAVVAKPNAEAFAAALERGEKLLSSGDLTGAMSAFEAAAKLDPEDARPGRLRGVVLERQGALLLARGELAAAENDLVAATRCDPKNADALFSLGLLRETQQSLPEAVAAYRSATGLRPTDPTFRTNLSTVLRRMEGLNNDLVEAQASRSLYDATLLHPKDVRAWTERGRVELRRGQLGRAVEALAKAAQLAPKDAAIAAYYCRAQVGVEKDVERARKAAEMAHTFEPPEPMNPTAQAALLLLALFICRGLWRHFAWTRPVAGLALLAGLGYSLYVCHRSSQRPNAPPPSTDAGPPPDMASADGFCDNFELYSGSTATNWTPAGGIWAVTTDTAPLANELDTDKVYSQTGLANGRAQVGPASPALTWTNASIRARIKVNAYANKSDSDSAGVYIRSNGTNQYSLSIDGDGKAHLRPSLNSTSELSSCSPGFVTHTPGPMVTVSPTSPYSTRWFGLKVTVSTSATNGITIEGYVNSGNGYPTLPNLTCSIRPGKEYYLASGTAGVFSMGSTQASFDDVVIAPL